MQCQADEMVTILESALKSNYSLSDQDFRFEGLEQFQFGAHFSAKLDIHLHRHLLPVTCAPSSLLPELSAEKDWFLTQRHR